VDRGDRREAAGARRDDARVSTVHDRARRQPTRRAAWGPRFVGPITALAVRAGIDDAAHFARPADVGADFGLTPRRYASGYVIRSGRITERGAGTVRTLLDEAANVPLVKITRSCAWRECGLAIATRGGTEFRWSAAPAAV
jgi:transposase